MILFGEDFDLAETVVAARPPDALELARAAQDEAAAAWRDAFAAGLAEGAARAAAEHQARVDRWTGLCARRLEEAARDVAEMADITASAVAGLVFDVLAKALPAFCARHGQAEIAALARGLLPALRTEPRIVIRVNPHDRSAIDAVLGEIPPDLRGHIVMTPTDSVREGDLQLGWQDGGMARDTAALLGQVNELLRQFGFVHEPA